MPLFPACLGLLFNMLGAIAQFETELRAERQMDGIHKAKQWGVQFGPKKKLVPRQVEELRHRWAEGVLVKTLMNDYNLSKASIYRYLGEIDLVDRDLAGAHRQTRKPSA